MNILDFLGNKQNNLQLLFPACNFEDINSFGETISNYYPNQKCFNSILRRNLRKLFISRHIFSIHFQFGFKKRESNHNQK